MAQDFDVSQILHTTNIVSDEGAWTSAIVNGPSVPLVLKDVPMEVTSICGSSTAPPPVISDATPTTFGLRNPLTVNGHDFGAKSGNVSVGGKPAKILSWTDTAVTFMPRNTVAGELPIVLTTKSKASVDGPSVTLQGPQLASTDSSSAKSGSVLTLFGQFFGSNKPKVYLLASGKKTLCQVLPGLSNTELRAKLPRVKAGNYQIVVSNAVGQTLDPVITVQVN